MIHDFPLTIPQQQKSDKIKILQIKTEQRTESKKNPKIKRQFQDIISNNKAKIRKKIKTSKDSSFQKRQPKPKLSSPNLMIRKKNKNKKFPRQHRHLLSHSRTLIKKK